MSHGLEAPARPEVFAGHAAQGPPRLCSLRSLLHCDLGGAPGLQLSSAVRLAPPPSASASYQPGFMMQCLQEPSSVPQTPAFLPELADLGPARTPCEGCDSPPPAPLPAFELEPRRPRSFHLCMGLYMLSCFESGYSFPFFKKKKFVYLICLEQVGKSSL